MSEGWTTESVLKKHNLWRELAAPHAGATAIVLQKQDNDIEHLRMHVNSLLAFFNPTYERPEALEVYCEAFMALNGYYPVAWFKLKHLPVPKSPMGESRSTDYEQAGREGPQGNASESPSYNSEVKQ